MAALRLELLPPPPPPLALTLSAAMARGPALLPARWFDVLGAVVLARVVVSDDTPPDAPVVILRRRSAARAACSLFEGLEDVLIVARCVDGDRAVPFPAAPSLSKVVVYRCCWVAWVLLVPTRQARSGVRRDSGEGLWNRPTTAAMATFPNRIAAPANSPAPLGGGRRRNESSSWLLILTAIELLPLQGCYLCAACAVSCRFAHVQQILRSKY